MQQDISSVDSAPNVIRRIALSVIETGHNRIAAAVGPTVASGKPAAVSEFLAQTASVPVCDRSDVAEVAN